MSKKVVFVGKLQPEEPRIPYSERHKAVPGPGSYELKSSIGYKEVASPRLSEPIFTIQKDGRDNYTKTYVSPQHQFTMPRNTTIKCDFIQKPGIGPQADSGKVSMPSYGFGTSTRDHPAMVL